LAETELHEMGTRVVDVTGDQQVVGRLAPRLLDDLQSIKNCQLLFCNEIHNINIG
jgi:hypothetical protein